MNTDNLTYKDLESLPIQELEEKVRELYIARLKSIQKRGRFYMIAHLLGIPRAKLNLIKTFQPGTIIIADEKHCRRVFQANDFDQASEVVYKLAKERLKWYDSEASFKVKQWLEDYPDEHAKFNLLQFVLYDRSGAEYEHMEIGKLENFKE